MNLQYIICFLLLCVAGRAETYEELIGQLKTSNDKYEVHRLKSQVARATMQRLETEELSKTKEKELRSQVLAYCADVQLGSMDIWYGEAVVSWGRLLLHDGKWKDARMQMLDQAEVLQKIEKNLKANKIPVSSISPVAGCRYVLGETYRLEFEKSQILEPGIEALKHYYNVYIKYNDSPWGEKAQAKAEAMQQVLEGKGKSVRIELGPHKKTFVASKFRLGARLIAEERFEDAVEPIETAINYFPETVQSVEALRNLAVCHIELGQDEEALMIAEYCCERFSSDTNAPLVILSLGRNASVNLSQRFYSLYLDAYPEHQHRADILSWFAWHAYTAEKIEEAVHYFHSLEAELRRLGETGERLEKSVYIQAIHPVDAEKLGVFMAEFPESQFMAPALSKKAQALLVAGDFSGAFQTLEKLEKVFPDSPASKKALSGLIVAAVEAEQFDIAEQVLNRMLEDKHAYVEDVYLSTGEGLLEAGQFGLSEKAFSAVPSNEHAFYGVASCRYGQEDFEGSFQILEKLLVDFPTTARFFDARLMQARCLVKLNRMDEAIAAYSEAGTDDHAVTLEMAAVLTEPEIKLAAYQRVALLADPDTKENRPLIAESIVSSLPLGMELQKYELVLGSCDQFEELFPEHDQLLTVVKYRREAERALAH